MSGAVDPKAGARRRAGRWSTVTGTVIGLAGAAFVVRALVRDREAVSDALSHARPGMLLLGVALGGLGLTGIGLAWHRAVRVLGGRIGVLDALRGYFVGQLGKYLPGGVWAIMGRGEWARSSGVPGAVAYSSVFLSMGSAYLAAVVLAAVLVPISGTADGDARYLLVLLLLPLGFALLHPRVVEAGLRVLRRTTGRELAVTAPPWRHSAAIVAQQVPSWLCIGAVSIVIGTALGDSGGAINVMTATAISWVVGFVVLPVPGGIGVRETAFVALATSLPSGIAAAVAVVARLTFIAVDGLGAAITAVMTRRRRQAKDVGDA